jgi:hypothetical protein
MSAKIYNFAIYKFIRDLNQAELQATLELASEAIIEAKQKGKKSVSGIVVKTSVLAKFENEMKKQNYTVIQTDILPKFTWIKILI